MTYPGDTPQSPENPLPLATLGPNGKAPKQRLCHADQAQTLYWTMQEAALPRLSRAAIIQGLFDGNPPYSQSKRRELGQAWKPNFNSLDGSSRLEAAKVPYYDLLSSSPRYAECETDLATDTVDAATASMQRSIEFDRLLRSYGSFNDQFWTCLTDFIAFNKGFLWFPRPDSWHFKRLPWHKVYFPDGTSTDPDDWELFAIQHSWPVHKLYGYVKDEDAAQRAGWNVRQVWQAIEQAVPDDVGQQYRDPMSLQQAFRDSELTMTARLGTVQAASLYVREFDGTWSRMMVQVERGTQRAGTPVSRVDRDRSRLDTECQVKSKDWLYNKVKVADHLNEILCPFIFEVGDGSINELSGLGRKIISSAQASDRLLNEVVGSAFMQSSIVMQPVTGAAQAKQGIIQFGGSYTMLPAGYTIQPGTIWGNLEAPLAVGAELRNRMDTNTGTYRPQFEKPRGNPESATGANIRFTQGSILTNSAVNRFFQQLDPFFYEIYRRATLSLPRTSRDDGVKKAIEFQERLRDAGLSDRQIKDCQHGSVKAMRSIGNGSPMMRQQMMAALAQIVPYMGPRGLQAWKIDFAAAFSGQNGAARYFPAEDLHEEPPMAAREATSENADFQTGAPVLWLESDDHEVHAKIHLTAAVAAIQSTEQGADPSAAFTFLQLAMPHTVLHIQKVPREQIRKALEQAYMQVAQGAQKVFKTAQEKVQQGEQQQQLSFEQQIAMMEAQHKAQMAEFKSTKLTELKAQRQNFDLQLKEQSTRRDEALKDATTAAAIQRSTAETVSAIESERAITQAKIENDRRKVPTNGSK